MKATPPKWADRFLEWYCQPALLEEIQGDAYELFNRTSKQNPRLANLAFVWNVIRFFRWRNIRKDRLKPYHNTSSAMFKSYFTTGFRNMLRNAVPSTINIVGLSVAIGCAVMIFILEDSYYNLDTMHEKSDRIGLIVNHVKEGEGVVQWARSPHPLAETLMGNAAVEHSVRAVRGGASVRVGDRVFNESVLFADPTFMDVFSFRTLSGNRVALMNKNQLLLTEDMAIKYFGNKNVVGQVLSLKFSDDFKLEFTVGAVLENTPANSSMYFSFLIPMKVWEDMNGETLEDWSKNTSVTFVLVKEGTSFQQLQTSLDAFKSVQNKSNIIRPLQKAVVVPLLDVAQVSYEINGSLSWSNAPAAMVAFAVIAVLLILLACFNYMNVAVASVSTRLKEIGVRKVIGGGKKEIIQQFLVENVVLCLIALAFGTAIAYFFLLPSFDSLYPITLAFEFSTWKTVLLFFGGLLLFVSIVSGAYPALYVSSFNAVKILRGKEKFGSKSMFSKILLGFQFTLSITTIVACLMFVWSSYYFEDKDWGYNRENTVVVQVQNEKQYSEMKHSVASNKEVVSMGGAQFHIGKSSQQAVIYYNEQEYSVTQFPIGFQYLESLNIRLKSGRQFDEAVASDQTESVMVNEAFVKRMGWKNALGQSFQLDSTKRFVVGVVEDFYYNDFFYKVEPAMFLITPEENFRFLAVKTSPGQANVTAENLQAAWRKTAPDDPYRGFMQNEVFDNFINSNRANNKVIYFISGVAVLLVGMGLYGLVSYNLTRRLKEFSVRKVFGASVPQIFRLMNRDYLWIVLISFVLGAPLGAFLMNLMLTAAYPEKIPTSLWPYVIAITVMIATVCLTVLSQLRRITHENPTETLRID